MTTPRRKPVRTPRKPANAQTKEQAKAKAKATRAATKPADPLRAYQEKIAQLSAIYSKGSKKGGEGEAEKQKVRFHVQAVPLTGEVSSKVLGKVSTGSLELDRILDGGIPLGRFTEIFGPEHVGKSTVMDHIFANVQRIKGVGVLADAEQARDDRYTAQLGVDVSKLQVLEFPRGELSAEAICNTLLDSAVWWAETFFETPVVMGWDAIGGTSTLEELSKRVGDRPVASAAKILSEMGRRLPNAIAGTRVAIVVNNHEYDMINYGRPGAKNTYGGKGPRHAATIRIKMFPRQAIRASDGRVLGKEVETSLWKNRLGDCGSCTIAILDGSGISNTYSVYHSLVAKKIIGINGSWSKMVLDGQELNFQGWAGLEHKIRERDDLWPRLVSVYNEVTRAPVSV